MGGMIQVNSAANAINGVFGIPPIIVGIVFGAITVWTAIRGREGILTVTEKLVPFMTVGFLLLSVAVICIYPDRTLNAFSLIFKNAFTLKSGVGGVAGFMLSSSIRYGTMRGILSNEAGCGTAPAAHAVSSCKIPAKQGAWGIFEVFVDTILLCTLTAIVIIVGFDGVDPKGDFMMMTVNAYTSLLGNFSGYFIAISVLLFGLATVLCWAHYGIVSVKYLSSRRLVIPIFIAVYSTAICLGSVLSADIIWDGADLSIGIMTFINVAILIKLSGEVKRETESYFGKRKKRDKE
jgi:AGCS family alanine or glycine:cation symporter